MLRDESGDELDSDAVLLRLGKWGRYQFSVFMLGNIVLIVNAMQILSPAFSHLQPQFTCLVHTDAGSELAALMHTSNVADNGTVRLAPNECTLWIPGPGGDNGTVHCGRDGRTTFLYNMTNGESHTVVTEWGLSCWRTYLSDLGNSALFFGYMVNSALITNVADRYGRRPVLLGSIVGFLLSATGTYLTPVYELYVLLRVISGFMAAGLGVVGYVLACESVPLPIRHHTPLAMGIWWTMGYCMVGPLAAISVDWGGWRAFLAMCSIPNWLLLTYFWICPESLHWLMATGQWQKACEWVERAAKCNGIEANFIRYNDDEKHVASVNGIAASSVSAKSNEVEGPCNCSLAIILSSPVLICHVLIMSYLWLCNAFVYFGLSLFSTSLAGDKYVNFTLSGLVELPSWLLISVTLNYLGRRGTMLLHHTLAGVSLLALTVLPAGTPAAYSLAIWLVGKFAIASSFNTVWLYGAELFPTVVRSTGVGVCNVASRFGGVIAPFVKTMAAYDESLPSLVFGLSSLLAGALVALLPETHGKELVDHVDDARPGGLLVHCFPNNAVRKHRAQHR